MLKKLSIRWRLTILSALLLTFCSVSLTIVLNVSAFLLADNIEAAVPTMPAIELLPTQGEKEPAEVIIPSIPLEDMREAKLGFSVQSMMYMLFVIFGGSALTYYLAGKALKPLDRLSNQVKNLTVLNLSEALQVPPTKDEIAELTQHFNEMTDKLNQAFMSQKRFSANAAHELRTPLAVLQTKVDVFKKRSDHSSDEYDALINVFEKQIDRLRSLVGDLLDMSNRQEDIEKTSICLSDIFVEIITELSDIAKNKDVTFKLHCESSTILGNVDLLYRAFYNLIENGIKYNIRGGHVVIEAENIANGHVQIVIKNSGTSIPDSMKKDIFEPFYRVDKSRSREIGGIGLGLSIANSIIKKHDGTITVYDNDLNETCFKIII